MRVHAAPFEEATRVSERPFRDTTQNRSPTSLVRRSGVTCQRLRDWTEAGVWPALREQLPTLDELDVDRCAVDGSHVRALTGVTGAARTRWSRAAPLQAPCRGL